MVSRTTKCVVGDPLCGLTDSKLVSYIYHIADGKLQSEGSKIIHQSALNWTKLQSERSHSTNVAKGVLPGFNGISSCP